MNDEALCNQCNNDKDKCVLACVAEELHLDCKSARRA